MLTTRQVRGGLWGYAPLTNVVSSAGEAYDPRGEFCALSLADRLSRVSSHCAGVAVPLLELPGTSLPRANIAFARVSVLTSNNVGICVDDEYATAYRGH